ncbi:MAG: 16S rRNA (guanine(527)-N(7))-methyltransferase RsmG [Chlorobi bacterium]|nr:16S rRNA (guanine(527)-N(7))-methyltransferase RsmG [Chlorobiota bacterium]MCI0716588.1 16S rRNA (guanine(527)-N(7))-methyltransferase RsmG [Chlorobiota bacterium]
MNKPDNWQAILKEKQFNDLLIEWNKKINLVSRKKPDVFDLIEDSKLFFEAINFTPGNKILDLGTGGGFPGIVIALHHPEAELTLIDSIQKKINVVSDIVKQMELQNVNVICARAEEISQSPEHKSIYDYVVARSVTVLQDLAKWSKELLKPSGKLVAVKGGDIKGELSKTKRLSFVKNVRRIEKNERTIIIVELANYRKTG